MRHKLDQYQNVFWGWVVTQLSSGHITTWDVVDGYYLIYNSYCSKEEIYRKLRNGLRYNTRKCG